MPRDAVIENPVINSPFRQPDRHFRFDEEGITSDVVDGRRASSYFVPIASARKRGGQQTFETEWTSTADEDGMFPPQYAEVYGVPFSFIPAAGSAPEPKPGPPLPPSVRLRSAWRDRDATS